MIPTKNIVPFGLNNEVKEVVFSVFGNIYSLQ